MIILIMVQLVLVKCGIFRLQEFKYLIMYIYTMEFPFEVRMYVFCKHGSYRHKQSTQQVVLKH